MLLFEQPCTRARFLCSSKEKFLCSANYTRNQLGHGINEDLHISASTIENQLGNFS